MKYYMRLPRGKREFCLFMAVISIISVNLIAPVATAFEMGFTREAWNASHAAMPFIWLTVVACVIVTYLPAEWLTARILEKDDSYNAHIVVNILVTVVMMSVLLTIIAPWVASGRIDVADSLTGFIVRWPRNFSVSLVVEALIAQPIARVVMNRMHLFMDGRAQRNRPVEA